MEIIKTIKDGNSSVENHITIKDGSYTHKQIERRDNLVFMRIKSRKLYETT